MQRGLRLNPTSTLLWHEYFGLELAYVKKIKTRREILGLSTTASKEEVQQADEENVINLPVITKEDEWFRDKREDVQMDEQKIEGLKEENNKVLQGELAKIVYLNAIAGIYRHQLELLALLCYGGCYTNQGLVFRDHSNSKRFGFSHKVC